MLILFSSASLILTDSVVILVLGLLQFLTIQEAVRFFAEIKEIPEAKISSAWRQTFSIISNKYINFPINCLSGGNKKKLAVVLSNLGSPHILLLDE